MGLGGGAIVATPVIDHLLCRNFQAPTQIDDTLLVSHPNAISLDEKGQTFIDFKEIPNISNIDLESGLTQIAKLDCSQMISAGFSSNVTSHLVDGGTYIIGTGSTGAAATMLIMGSGYLVTILVSSMFTKLPHSDFDPIRTASQREIGRETRGDDPNQQITHHHSMSVEEAFKTPQFWCMWIAFGALSSTGMGCISTAKTIMSETFGGVMPLVVTSSFASTYVMAISASNLAGRVGWGFISDKIGQFPTYSLFGIVGAMLYGAIPFYVSSVVESPSLAPLALFYGSTLFLFSCFGGGFSVMPSYEAKMFGAKNVGAIHGRMMTACAASGFIGPTIVSQCRQSSYNRSVHELAEFMDPKKFEMEFGANMSDLDMLIESKVVTISRLMQIIQEEMGIVDPTPFLYDTTMYAMSGCLGICAIANLALKRMGPPKQML